MDYNRLYNEIAATDNGCRILLEILVEDYGPKDAVRCTFPHICEEDQRRFLELAHDRLHRNS